MRAVSRVVNSRAVSEVVSNENSIQDCKQPPVVSEVVSNESSIQGCKQPPVVSEVVSNESSIQGCKQPRRLWGSE